MTSPTTAASGIDDDLIADWVECWQCWGDGELDDCFEDTCVCIEPPCCTTRCDVCRGKGGWYATKDANHG